MLSAPLMCVRAAAAHDTINLENGLTVLVHEMPGFTGVHAVYATKFGSVDREFEANGKRYLMPAGMAHFLEHKMFENEDGDAFELYAKTGANANAYTSFEKTCYIFTATGHTDENLDILLSFVSHPYFTDETVKKEQGIIGQEISMYDDSPEWRLIFTTYQCLYNKSWIKDDIAGTAETIAEITPELLYACTDAFYRPENMVLSVAGNVTRKQVLEACARADIKPKRGKVTRIIPEETDEIPCAYKEFTMSVAKPLLSVGFKEKPLENDVLKGEIVCDMITELICGGMTPLYRKLYDEGLVSPGFSGEFLSLSGANCMVFGGETSEPEKVRDLLLAEIARVKKDGVDKQLFALCKNMMYGELVSDLENIDDVASGMASAHFKNRSQADEIAALAMLEAEDVNAALASMLCEERSATVIIRPAGQEQE